MRVSEKFCFVRAICQSPTFLRHILGCASSPTFLRSSFAQGSLKVRSRFVTYSAVPASSADAQFKIQNSKFKILLTEE